MFIMDLSHSRWRPVIILVTCLFLVITGVAAAGDGPTMNSPENIQTGRVWKQVSDNAPFGLQPNLQLVVFGGKMWVVGEKGVWYSSDGGTWTPATSQAAYPSRSQYRALAFKGRLWVIGGESDRAVFNDTWFSQDGNTWTEATPHAAFPARYEHTAVVFHDRMWVIGGRGKQNTTYPYDEPEYNDVWYSDDGITWIEATPHAAFSPRYSPVSFVFNDSIWVIGSYHDDELWRSPDGVGWTLVADRPYMFAPKSSEQPPVFLVFDSLIWRITAFTSGYPGESDVWYSPNGVNWTSQGPFYYPTSDSHISSNIRAGVVYDNRIFLVNEFQNRTPAPFWESRYSYLYTDRNMVWYTGPDANTYQNLTLPLDSQNSDSDIGLISQFISFLKGLFRV